MNKEFLGKPDKDGPSVFAWATNENVDNNGNTIIRAWNPTPEQLANYKKREIELAKHNIKSLGIQFKLFDRDVIQKLRQSTLHSEKTIAAAI